LYFPSSDQSNTKRKAITTPLHPEPAKKLKPHKTGLKRQVTKNKRK